MEVMYTINEHIGILAHHQTGWNKELNLVSWNGAPPKYDIRDWDPTHEHMTRGLTLHEHEMNLLVAHYTEFKSKRTKEHEEALKSWICEHVVDGYDEYAKVLEDCGFSMREIADDLDGVCTEDEILAITSRF